MDIIQFEQKKIDGTKFDWYDGKLIFDLKPSYISIKEKILLKEATILWKNPAYLKEVRRKFK
ncbi:MAG: hypothetical protein BAJALOKI2v1_250022 [Promethearchaeota archaeon]|nr:MAG: hypothetical protein BAJALOKI2v1_250022 [Candidatus Lokiarchaeota archaeon]